MGLKRVVNKADRGLERVRHLGRALRRLQELSAVVNRSESVRSSDVLLFCTLRNERARLPYFLSYYRQLGISHFFFVDNASDDGSAEFLCDQQDCSVWTTPASYKRARYGMDWINALLTRFAHRHWVLVVDVDEFFVYPYMETRPLPALTDWLAGCRHASFGTLLLDMYAATPIADTPYVEGTDPFETLAWFDAANYSFDRNGKYRDLWIQGGPRQRVFFPDEPAHGPALNKVPLVHWKRGWVYRSSTHTLMPRGLNKVYETRGGERACGVLLHAKFMKTFSDKAAEERARKQHYAASREYRVYNDRMGEALTLKTPASTRYRGWRQLEHMGLISSGSWA